MTPGEKATEELAKLGQKSLDTVDRLGGWTDSVFGKGLRHLGSAFEDSMAGFRLRNRIKVIEKTRAAIDQSGLAGKTRPLDPRISMPIMDAISDESDETLQDVWAAYIKNAVDPKKANPDRILIEVVRRLEPGDWPILKKTFPKAVGRMTSEDFGLSDTELVQALDRMETLQLFDYDDPTIHYLVMGKGDEKRLMISVGDADYYATRLLRRLAIATTDDNEEHET